MAKKNLYISIMFEHTTYNDHPAIQPVTTMAGQRPCFYWDYTDEAAISPSMLDTYWKMDIAPAKEDIQSADDGYDEHFWLTMELKSDCTEYKLGIQLLCEMGWGEVAVDAMFQTLDWLQDLKDANGHL